MRKGTQSGRGYHVWFSPAGEKFSTLKAAHESLRMPAELRVPSLEQLLHNFSLPQYADAFLREGYDCVQWLLQMDTEEDFALLYRSVGMKGGRASTGAEVSRRGVDTDRFPTDA